MSVDSVIIEGALTRIDPVDGIELYGVKVIVYVVVSLAALVY